jgi:HD-like signal output (HDOD) protein
MLKLVNSAFYGFPGRIGTIKHALVLLGYDVVKSLILSATVFDMMSDKWSMLWKHSIAVSKACGLICNRRKIPDAEEVGMAGLLHDVGKVVMLVVEPKPYQKVIDLATKKGLPMYAAEKNLLDFDHVDVANWLCERWNLPKRLCSPMIFHHKPLSADYAETQTAVLFMANNLAKAIGWGTTVGAKVEPTPPEFVELLKIDQALLADLVNSLEKELQSI